MPKLGSYDYPVSGLERVIDAAKKAASEFHDETFNRDALAACLGFKNSNTGSFNQLLADLKKYELLDGRGNDIHVTEIAKQLIAYADESEYARAVASAFFSIPLFKELYEKYQGAKPDEQSFFTSLLHLSKADRMEVKKQASRIRELFVEGSRVVGKDAVNSGRKGTVAASKQERAEGASMNSGLEDQSIRHAVVRGQPGLKEYSDGTVFVRVPDDPRQLEDLRDLLDLWLAKARQRLAEESQGDIDSRAESK